VIIRRGGIGRVEVPGYEIRVQVCFQDTGDPESHLPCGGDIPSGITFRIDDSTGPVTGEDAGAVSRTG
jgi:hypothetical protein